MARSNRRALRNKDIQRALDRSTDRLTENLTRLIERRLAQKAHSRETTSQPNNSSSRSMPLSCATMGERHDSLAADIAKLFTSGQFADVTIHLGEEFVLSGHSCILATRSEYFNKALNSGLKEARSKEFRFSEGSVHAYWRVFQFIYTGDYCETTSAELSSPDDNELMLHFQVYMVAKYFLIDQLVDIALQRFESKSRSEWDSKLLTKCIQDVYDSTTEDDRQVRNVILDLTRRYQTSLRDESNFRDLLRQGGDFVLDLVVKSELGI
ncbi:BTB/POZ domain containing protein [Fusarium sp. Ph1]|nr:BTB/POZ domain containing protein [Fusarium sp. Ph1]